MLFFFFKITFLFQQSLDETALYFRYSLDLYESGGKVINHKLQSTGSGNVKEKALSWVLL